MCGRTINLIDATIDATEADFTLTDGKIEGHYSGNDILHSAFYTDGDKNLHLKEINFYSENIGEFVLAFVNFSGNILAEDCHIESIFNSDDNSIFALFGRSEGTITARNIEFNTISSIPFAISANSTINIENCQLNSRTHCVYILDYLTPNIYEKSTIHPTVNIRNSNLYNGGGFGICAAANCDMTINNCVINGDEFALNARAGNITATNTHFISRYAGLGNSDYYTWDETINEYVYDKPWITDDTGYLYLWVLPSATIALGNKEYVRFEDDKVELHLTNCKIENRAEYTHTYSCPLVLISANQGTSPFTGAIFTWDEETQFINPPSNTITCASGNIYITDTNDYSQTILIEEYTKIP